MKREFVPGTTVASFTDAWIETDNNLNNDVKTGRVLHGRVD